MQVDSLVQGKHQKLAVVFGLLVLASVMVPGSWLSGIPVPCVAAEAQTEAGADEDSYEAQKREMLSRERRIILNNDGGDATVGREGLDSPRDFLDIRTTPLFDANAESHVDVISYCTSRTYGTFLHRTEVGTMLTTQEEPYENNVFPALLEEGTDPLQVMIDYCREKDMEIFWSMRMNDTHDAGRPERYRRNPFKVANQDCLMGTLEDRPRYGGWSAVNYGCEVVRNLLRDVVEELCQNYDLDGIELDFFRHPVFFKQTSQGKPVSDTEREQMTGLIREIAQIAERAGRERGRPFLIAARTPDDVAYANTIGLEIEKWMKEGFIDIWIPSGYFRLNTWEHHVELGHEHDVQVYPGLSETRVGGGHHAHAGRASDESYRARAMTAWDAGMDGIYIFNLFDPHRTIWTELGDPSVLKSLDKIYFASVRGPGRVAGGAYPHDHFNKIPEINPDSPDPLRAGQRRAVSIRMGEDLEGLSSEDLPEITLSLQIQPGAEGLEELMVAFNGNELSGTGEGEWIHFAVPANDVRTGENTVELHYTGERDDLKLADVVVSVDYSGKLLEDASYLERTRERM